MKNTENTSTRKQKSWVRDPMKFKWIVITSYIMTFTFILMNIKLTGTTGVPWLPVICSLVSSVWCIVICIDSKKMEDDKNEIDVQH